MNTAEMAHEAGVDACTCGCLERFAELVRADERAQRTWVELTDAETDDLWEISRAAMPRYHTFKTLIEKALRERNTWANQPKSKKPFLATGVSDALRLNQSVLSAKPG